jgi:hypothetical protein
LKDDARANPVDENKLNKIIDIDNFQVFHYICKKESFTQFINSLQETRSFSLDGLKIIFFGSEKDPRLEYEIHNSKNSEQARKEWNLDWATDCFKWQSDHVLQNELSEIFKQINYQLNCYNPPYKSAAEVITEHFDMKPRHVQGTNPRDSICYLQLPNYLLIEDSALDGTEFSISVKFHPSIQPEQIHLGLIAQGKQTSRERIIFTESEVRKLASVVDQHYTGTCSPGTDHHTHYQLSETSNKL